MIKEMKTRVRRSEACTWTTSTTSSSWVLVFVINLSSMADWVSSIMINVIIFVHLDNIYFVRLRRKKKKKWLDSTPMFGNETEDPQIVLVTIFFVGSLQYMKISFNKTPFSSATRSLHKWGTNTKYISCFSYWYGCKGNLRLLMQHKQKCFQRHFGHSPSQYRLKRVQESLEVNHCPLKTQDKHSSLSHTNDNTVMSHESFITQWQKGLGSKGLSKRQPQNKLNHI